MRGYSRTHLSDAAVASRLNASTARKCEANADLLADLAEFDSRKLFRTAGYSSMFRYCVRKLQMSRQGAYKRIRVARLARAFPVIFQVVEQGRVHISGLVMLAHHMTRENVEGLLQAATHKTEIQIEQLLAERFPRPDLPALVETLTRAEAPPGLELSSRRVEFTPMTVPVDPVDPVANRIETVPDGPGEPELSLKRVESASPRAKVTALAPARFGIQFTFGQVPHDKLEYAQQLLGHQVAPGDLAQVFERALDALIMQLEHKKFAATDRPRAQKPRVSNAARSIPNAVKREVWQRDRGQCTFVSDSGHRCEEKSGLEFDHIEPVARGGTSTVRNLRLRCRAHNQFEAEKSFGSEFMRSKRERLSPGQAQAGT